MEFRRVRNLINGEWINSNSKEILEVRNPALNEVIAEVPMSTQNEVHQAIQGAKEAFPEWRSTPPPARARHLFRLKELLEGNFDELSIVQTKEHGKTIDESRGETRRGIENAEAATGIPSLMMGESLQDIAVGIDVYTIRKSLGIFSCIPLFNFPFIKRDNYKVGIF